jgi:endonuclease/exonuclease/phosphatase family metal-dependent hydrolase
VLIVANYNVHAGVDGWGRRFPLIPACASFDADVLVLQESWTDAADGPGHGQAEAIAEALGYQVITCELGVGRRQVPRPDAGPTWMPRLGLFKDSENSLYLDGVRPLPRSVLASPLYASAEPGSWGIAVLVRQSITIEATRTLQLETLRHDRVRRALIVVDLTIEGVSLSVVGTHMAHLRAGSPRHYAAARRLLATEARSNAVLLGDMNLWGPPVRTFLPSWHRAVKGRTWPAWNPHSQIDHILTRGAIEVTSGEVLPDAGSDHRPVRATLTFG